MGPEKINDSVSELSGFLPEVIVSKINFILGFIQALGIFLFLYVIYLVVNTIMEKRRNKQINEISKKLDKLDSKIDNLKAKKKK